GAAVETAPVGRPRQTTTRGLREIERVSPTDLTPQLERIAVGTGGALEKRAALKGLSDNLVQLARWAGGGAPGTPKRMAHLAACVAAVVGCDREQRSRTEPTPEAEVVLLAALGRLALQAGSPLDVREPAA